jgi:hypothetical protein
MTLHFFRTIVPRVGGAKKNDKAKQEKKADGSHQALRLPLYAGQIPLTRYSA